jgi:hypothetical protein
MTNDDVSTELFILDRERLPLLLVPDSDGVPCAIHPQPTVLRGAYLSTHELETGGLIRAKGQLNQECPLLVPVSCADGAPLRSCLYFQFVQRLTGMPWRDGSNIRYGDNMRQYGAATDRVSYQWLSDARAGNRGYLVTGTSGEDSLWRLFRLESDVFHRIVLTLAPVRFNSVCPLADFSAISDSVQAGQLKQQYDDLCRSAGGYEYRHVVTTARNIVEGLISARLSSTGQPSTGRIFDDLKTVRKLLDDSKTRDTCGWSDTDYHLAQKIRLVHGQTHIQQTLTIGRPLRPEFGLSVVDDLVELLRAWGYCTP